MGAWLVPLGSVLDAHELEAFKPYAFVTSATAAFVSPLLFGAMADRHFAPVRVLRWLAAATAAALMLVALTLRSGASGMVVLGAIQLQSLCAAPTWGLTSSIVFSRLRDAQRQFGPIRALGSLGWMVGCWLISGFDADRSTTFCYASAGLWVLVIVLTFFLPAPPPGAASEGGGGDDGGVRLTLAERFGWDALTLLRHHDHRVMFVTLVLFSIPLAAFYPYTPRQLHELGFVHTAAWMTLGQVTEVIAMFALSAVVGRLGIKYTVAVGLGFGLLRFLCCAANTEGLLLLGILLHGACFTCVFITAQIYLDQRVAPAWRVRAQALVSMLTGGVGNLFGYLGTGGWFAVAQRAGERAWPLFWGGLAGVIALILGFFLVSYRGGRVAAAKPLVPST